MLVFWEHGESGGVFCTVWRYQGFSSSPWMHFVLSLGVLETVGAATRGRVPPLDTSQCHTGAQLHLHISMKALAANALCSFPTERQRDTGARGRK